MNDKTKFHSLNCKTANHRNKEKAIKETNKQARRIYVHCSTAILLYFVIMFLIKAAGLKDLVENNIWTPVASSE
jgi:hypothetical protein